MAVGHGSDIKFFVHFDQLRDEILLGDIRQMQCAYYINSDQRCLERMSLLDADWLLADKFFRLTDRAITDARRSRRHFLCQKHFDDTRRASSGFFIRAGWCSRSEPSPGIDVASTARSPLHRKERAQLIVTLQVPSLRQKDNTANDSMRNLTSPTKESPEVQPPQQREKRRIGLNSETTPRKRHKPSEETAKTATPPRTPFSATKLLALTSSSHTDFRGMWRSKRSIDHTPSFEETFACIVRQDRNECIGMAAKTLQRCRRPIVVDKLKNQLKWTPMILTLEYLWDMLDFLLCEKHASEQSRYTVIQRWSFELGIDIDGLESPAETLPTPATSIAPSSPQARPGEIDLTMDSNDDAIDDQSGSTGGITSPTHDAPSATDACISPRMPLYSSPNLSPNRPLTRDIRMDTVQKNRRASTRMPRRSRNSVHPATTSIHRGKACEPVTLNDEADVAPGASTEESAQEFCADAENGPDNNSSNDTSPNDVPGSSAEAPTSDMDLGDADMPTLSVDDTEPDPIAANMPWEAYQAVKDEMLTPIDQEGHVYVMRSPSRPGLVKIGKAVDITVRKNEIQKTCKLDDLEVVRDLSQMKIYHVAKLERLCHKELKIVQKADFKCNNPDHASRGVSHREWFKIDGNEAVKVVQRWRTWLKSKPYGDVRIQSLKEGWVHKIEDHFPEPEEDEHDVHDHGRRNQKLNDFVNLGLGVQ